MSRPDAARPRPASVEGERRSVTVEELAAALVREVHVDLDHGFPETATVHTVARAIFAALPASTESGSRVDGLTRNALEVLAIRVREYDGEEWVSMDDIAEEGVILAAAPSEPEAPGPADA